MSSKKRNLRSPQVSAEKTAPLVPHSEGRGAALIEVVIRSESIRMVGNVALEEAPVLLSNMQDLAAKFPRIFTGRWECGKILGLQHCYAFEMAPVCSDGIEVDLGQIVCDVRRLLDRSIQKLEELPRRGTVASLRKLDISNAEFEVLKCLRDIEANGGSVELSVVSKPPHVLAATDATSLLVPPQLVEGSTSALEVSSVQMPIKAPKAEAFLAVAREARPAARVAGRVIGIEDLPDARVAITVNGGKPMPAPDLNRDTAIELYRANAEVQGLLTPMGPEMVLTKLTWQARLPLESAPM